MNPLNRSLPYSPLLLSMLLSCWHLGAAPKTDAALKNPAVEFTDIVIFPENPISPKGSAKADALSSFAIAFSQINQTGKVSEESLEMLIETLRKDPHAGLPLTLLIAHHAETGTLDNATRVLLPIALEHPGALRLNIQTAALLTNEERQPEARYLLEDALESSPLEKMASEDPDTMAELLDALSKLYTQADDPASGEKLWDKVLAIPDIACLPAARVAAIVFYSRFADQGPDGFFSGWSKRRYRRKLEDNISAFEILWDKPGMQNISLLQPLFEVFKRYDMQDRGETLILQNLLEQIESPMSMFTLIQLYSDTGRHADLYRAWRIIIETNRYPQIGQIWKFVTRGNGNDADFYMEMGIAALSAGFLQEAVRAFDWFLMLNPNHQEGLYHIGIAYLKMYQYEKAADKFSLAKNLPEAHFLRAKCYSGAGDYKRALEALETAKDIVKDDPARSNFIDRSFLIEYAFTADLAGDFEKTQSTLEGLISEFPDDHVINNFLGYLWADKDINLDQSLELIKKALAAEPENAAYLDSMAWVLYRKKRFKEALSYINKALKLEGELPDAVISDHAGDIHFALGNIKKAVEFWTLAIGTHSQHLDKKAISEKIRSTGGRQ
ncbi:MAG: tetratricopeptide repeat protein [Victivallales bacterium]|nr:tetratricopeptide repeat protein [Victivallales bacterium]